MHRLCTERTVLLKYVKIKPDIDLKRIILDRLFNYIGRSS